MICQVSHATLFWLDLNVTKLFANLIPSRLYFIVFQIVMCNFVEINIIIITIIILNLNRMLKLLKF